MLLKLNGYLVINLDENFSMARNKDKLVAEDYRHEDDIDFD